MTCAFSAIYRWPPERPELACRAVEPIIGSESRHLHPLVRNVGYDDALPVAAHAKPDGFGLSVLQIELRAFEAIAALGHCRWVAWEILSTAINVQVAGENHQRIAKQADNIVLSQANAAKPVGIRFIERRQGVPAGIGRADCLKDGMRLRRHQPVHELPARRMTPQIHLVARSDSGLA